MEYKDIVNSFQINMTCSLSNSCRSTSRDWQLWRGFGSLKKILIEEVFFVDLDIFKRRMLKTTLNPTCDMYFTII